MTRTQRHAHPGAAGFRDSRAQGRPGDTQRQRARRVLEELPLSVFSLVPTLPDTQGAPALTGTIASLASIKGALRTAWNGAKRSSSISLARLGQRTPLRTNFNLPQRPLTRTFGPNTHYIRWQTFSTSSDTAQESELIPLNDSLRRLYLKVHPDFFSQWPEVQSVNEQSFQNLMAFLDELEQLEDNPDAPPHKMRYPLVFFLKDDKSTAKIQEADPPIDGLRRIEMTLESQTYRQSLRVMHDSLAKLFDFCAVDHSLREMGQEEPLPKRRQWKEEFSLSHFAGKIHETARQKSMIRLSIERELDMERMVFYIQHRIRIAMDVPDELSSNWSLFVDTERALLRRLESVLKILFFEKHMDLERIANTTVCFGVRSGIDLIGRIGLKIADTDQQWIDQIFSIDRNRIDAIKEGSADRFDKEKQLSDALGLGFMYTDYALGGSEKYKDYVQRLLDLVMERKTTFVGLESVRLRVLESQSLEHVKSDKHSCTISVPICMDPSEVLSTISDLGPELVRAHDKINRSQEELNTLILDAKRKFRLRSLKWDSSISNSQLQTCVTNILRYSAQLARFLDGQRIRVSEQYDLDLTDGTINIRWDFMI